MNGRLTVEGEMTELLNKDITLKAFDRAFEKANKASAL